MKKHFTRFFVSFWALATFVLCHAEVGVTDVVVTPRWPWKGLVDITYSIAGGTTDTQVWVELSGHDNDLNQDIVMHAVTGDGVSSLVTPGGPYTVTWDVSKDQPEFHSSSFEISVKVHSDAPLYLVVDLSGGTNASKYYTRYMDEAPDISSDTCRTTELWLRRIPAGTFLMGSPENELGRFDDETQHQVTLTQDYYIGVFECTQKQYELVLGSNPSSWKGDTRPVEQVYYSNLRGNSAASGWPAYGHAVDATSFFGKLQAKTGLVFDLPTEAQWEYACRAGTTTSLNSGKNITNIGINNCPNMAEVGRYRGNTDDGKGGYTGIHTRVGSYLPNAWGLYDMHGNVWEWCLDWTDGSLSGADPVGSSSGLYRVFRGGTWNGFSDLCTSSNRSDSLPSYDAGNCGFRLVWTLSN